MNEEEIILEYFLRFNEVKNMIIGLGEDSKLEVVVQKVFRSLPMRFIPNISTIEEMAYLKSLTMDQLLGTLIVY